MTRRHASGAAIPVAAMTPAFCHEDERQILRAEITPQAAGLLGTPGQLHETKEDWMVTVTGDVVGALYVSASIG